MARGKGGLGRGLDSLFEDAAPVFESEHAAVSYTHLPEKCQRFRRAGATKKGLLAPFNPKGEGYTGKN